MSAMTLRAGPGVTQTSLELAITCALLKHGWTWVRDDFDVLVVCEPRRHLEVTRIGPGLDPDAPTEIET